MARVRIVEVCKNDNYTGKAGYSACGKAAVKVPPDAKYEARVRCYACGAFRTYGEILRAYVNTEDQTQQ